MISKSNTSVGCIISGYQGIGKSNLANKANGYVDLESGNFFVDGIKDPNWHIPYCQIAIHLARQGYQVFVSTHKVVRDYLADFAKNIPLYLCFPSYSLKGSWIKKLEKRYNHSRLEKDYRAWKNAENRYDENIKELHETKRFIPIVIHDMSYSLEELIKRERAIKLEENISELVSCKDCCYCYKSAKTQKCYCEKWNGAEVFEEEFCARGEKKNES